RRVCTKSELGEVADAVIIIVGTGLDERGIRAGGELGSCPDSIITGCRRTFQDNFNAALIDGELNLRQDFHLSTQARRHWDADTRDYRDDFFGFAAGETDHLTNVLFGRTREAEGGELAIGVGESKRNLKGGTHVAAPRQADTELGRGAGEALDILNADGNR